LDIGLHTQVRKKNIIQLQEKRGGRLNRVCNTRAQKQTFDTKDEGEGTLDDSENDGHSKDRARQ